MDEKQKKNEKEIQHIKCVCISIFYSFSTREKKMNGEKKGKME